MATVLHARQALVGPVAKLAAGSALGGLLALGVDLTPAKTRAQALRIEDARTYPSVCPYCAVGCDTVVHVVDKQIVNIEGDVRSPINRGTLCPKGAAIFQLHENPNRSTQVLHRPAGATAWEPMDLQVAMERVADLVKETRDRTFVEKTADGKTAMATTAIFSLGGATMDNEWNYVQLKLCRALGLIYLENQARI